MGSKEKSKEKYFGIENYNNQGYLMKIVDYINYNNIKVEFSDPYKYIVNSRVDKFLNGEIQNPYAPSLCDFGIVGNKYPTHTKDGNYTREYLMWGNMIKRCYDEDHRYKNPSYYNCYCCQEWQYYEKFYEWLHSQENYDILNVINDIAIDKDILVKGNREYHPCKCTLVTQRINNIMLKSNSIRGDCCIGVYYHKRNNKYVAQCGGKKEYFYIGSYDTEIEAFEAYKKFKENQIKKLAKEEYELKHITKRCYDSLMSYQVEITD